jgi:hypothetical protein
VRRLLATAGVALLLLAVPASAENPVLDVEGDTDLAAALAEATEVQGVCYGYELLVDDQDTGQWGGAHAASSLGPGTRASAADPACRGGVVELLASIRYTSSYSELEDSAGWSLSSTLPELTIRDVEDLGLSAGDLLDDGRSELVLLNAVQALPRLAAEQAGKAPVVLEPNTAALPADAQPTGTPGSDWLREHAVLLGLCVALLGGGVLLLVLSFRTVRPGAGGATTFPDL